MYFERKNNSIKALLTASNAARNISNLKRNYIYAVYLFRKPSPGSSVGSDAGCQSQVCEFESRLGQLSFRRLTKVNTTYVIRLPPPLGYVEKQPVALENCCLEYWYEKTWPP